MFVPIILLEMRRNSKIAVLAVTGIVCLAAFSVAMILVPTSDPIKLSLQSYTNASAVITIKNQSSLPFDYTVMVERKIGGKWPDGLVPGTIIPENQSGSLGAGQHTNLTIPVMVYAPPHPWRISVFCWRNQPTLNFNSFRFKCMFWLNKLHMPKLARKLAVETKMLQVSGPPMQQYEK